MEVKTAHFKKGMILLWYGPVVLIPTGWQLCDGTNSTPDLRNRFIVGAGDTYNPAATGGTLTHLHTGDNSHTHTVVGGTDIAAGGAYNQTTGSPNKVGETGSADTLPPYYALAYIMKL